MKRCIYLLMCGLTLTLLTGADDKPDEKKDEKAKTEAKAEEGKKEETDQDRIQGRWRVESCQRDGKSSEDRVGDFDTYDGDKVTIESDKLNKSIEAKFSLDPAKKPPEINLIYSVENSGLNWGGIYKLDGDTLTICWSTPQSDNGRPTDFTSKAGDGKFLLVCKRVKAEKEEKK